MANPNNTKTFITVFITQTNVFRAKIVEPGKPAYEVTVGGESWKNGKGIEYRERILAKMKNMMIHLESQLLDIETEIEINSSKK